MNLPFTSKNALAERVRVNAYFLLRNPDKHTLYSMVEDLSYDVSEEIKNATKIIPSYLWDINSSIQNLCNTSTAILVQDGGFLFRRNRNICLYTTSGCS